MDLAAIRADLAAGATSLGFNAWDYEPDDPQDLPACIVSGLRTATRLNRIVTEATLSVAFYVSVASDLDAARKLDATMSVGLNDGNSYLDWLDAQAEGADHWRSIRFLSAGPYQRVQLPGTPVGPVALSVQIELELTA